MSWQEGYRNSIDLSSLDDYDLWFELADSPNSLSPICLPVDPHAFKCNWLCAAKNKKLFNELTEDLKALVGRSYASIDIFDSSEVEPTEWLDGLLEEYPGGVVSIRTNTDTDAQQIKEMLILYARLLASKPPTRKVERKSVGVLRGEFARALVAGDEVSARKIRHSIEKSEFLDANNKIFLEIRYLAGLNRWQELASNKDLLKSIIDLRIPKQTMIDVADAFYHCFFEEALDSGNVITARDRFKNSDFSGFSRLFGSRKGSKRKSLLVVLLFFNVVSSKPDETEINELLADLSDLLPGSQYQNLRKLLGAVEEFGSKDYREAYDDGELDRAFEVCKQVQKNVLELGFFVNLTKQLIRDCENMSDVLASFFSVIEDYSAEQLDDLSQKNKETIEELRQLFSKLESGDQKRTIESWFTWIDWALSIDDVGRLETVLQNQCSSWSLEQEFSSSDLCSAFAGKLMELQDKSVDHQELAQTVLTFLLESLDRITDANQARFKPLYCEMLTLMALRASSSKYNLELASQIIGRVLEAGPSLEEYSEMVRDLEHLMKIANSVNNLNWAMDVAELLNTYPDQDDMLGKKKIHHALLATAHANKHRLEKEVIVVLELLSRDLQLDLPEYFLSTEVDQTIDVEDSKIQNVKTVAIYTLTESAGIRAKKLLESIWSHIKVTINNDHAATDKLEALAKNSDLFVFAWKSSKHQAYYCVKDNRASDKPILLPLGKGSASIVSAVKEWAEAA